jgi:hypothetical protein
MTEERNHPRKSLPVADYSSALAKAVEWLGDRYVLAIPMKSPRNHVSPLTPMRDGPTFEEQQWKGSRHEFDSRDTGNRARL